MLEHLKNDLHDRLVTSGFAVAAAAVAVEPCNLLAQEITYKLTYYATS